MPNNGNDGTVYVYNKMKETFIATEATVADSYFTRLVGLLGKTRRWAQLGKGLWVVPSRGVHTIGMLFPIDLIFLSKDKEVVHLEEFVRPFRISKVSLKATSVLELPPHMLLASAIPVFCYAGSGQPNSWFHFPRGISVRSQHQQSHPAVKHYAANHPKAPRARNLHPRILNRNKPS